MRGERRRPGVGWGLVRVRLGVAALVVGSGLAAAASPVRAAAANVAPASGVTATPVLSIRRLPGWIVQNVATDRLNAALSAILTQPALGAAAQTSCVVVSEGAHTLFAANPTEALIPASNMKLLTATAVIEKLGPARRFVTEVVSARPVRGVVHGNLYLVGSGDPMLYTSGYAAALGQKQYTSLDDLALAIRQAGVTDITGSVVGDEGRYDQMRTVPTWNPVYATEGDVGPLSALEVNDGASPGPLSSPPTAAGANPASTSSSAALKAATSTNPAVLAAATFTKQLRSDGIGVGGAPASGARPAGLPVVATVTSAPLAQEVDAMLTVSDDTAAELFTKEMGVAASGKGTTTAGLAAIRAVLAGDGLPVGQMVALDGSGLDRGDKATCSLLEADLSHVGPSSVVGHGLPVAGQTGTLAGRMVGTAAASRLVAKTGTLDNVASLSGFVLPAKGAGGVRAPGTGFGQPLVFASILDGVASTTIGRAIGDQVGVALAAYPQAPPWAAVAPRR